MNRSTSVYLDAVRLFAALVVVLTHLAYPRFSGGLISDFARTATTPSWSSSSSPATSSPTRPRRAITTSGPTHVNRLARLYSVALPAVFLTWIFDEVGRRLDPALYDGFWYAGTDPLWRMLEALTFTSQLWLHSTRLFSNGPYWSLGYEFWYYAIFAASWYFAGWQRTLLVAAIAAIMGPKILLLLPVWLLGVWAYRFNQRARIVAPVGVALLVGSIALYARSVPPGCATRSSRGRTICSGEDFVRASSAGRTSS